MRRAFAIGVAMMALAATEASAADTPGVADWVQAGKVRLALFLPQYSEDPASHEITGIGTGYIGIDMMRGLARQLHIEAQVVGYSTSADVVNCLKSGACDVAFMEIEPSRAAQLDVTPPAFRSGQSDVGVATRKGHDARMEFLKEFVEDAKRDGIIQRAIDRRGLREFRVAPLEASADH